MKRSLTRLFIIIIVPMPTNGTRHAPNRTIAWLNGWLQRQALPKRNPRADCNPWFIQLVIAFAGGPDFEGLVT